MSFDIEMEFDQKYFPIDIFRSNVSLIILGFEPAFYEFSTNQVETQNKRTKLANFEKFKNFLIF